MEEDEEECLSIRLQVRRVNDTSALKNRKLNWRTLVPRLSSRIPPIFTPNAIFSPAAQVNFKAALLWKKKGQKKYLGLGEISLGRCQNQASSLPYFKSPGKWLSELGLQKITEDEKCGYWSSKNTANSAQSSNFWYLCAWRLSSTFPLHPHLFSSFSRSQMRMGSVSSERSCGKSCVGSNRSRIYFSWEYSNLLVNHP